MAPSEILSIVLKAGALSGLLSLTYIVVDNLRKRPRIKFDFLGSHREFYFQGSHQFCRKHFNGHIKNQGLEPTTITKVYLVVWANRHRNSTLRFGFGDIQILDKAHGKVVGPPLPLGPREARHVEVTCSFPIKGTQDERLLEEQVPLSEVSSLLKPKHVYELCFEDVNENLFDMDSHLRNRRELDLRWTLANTMNSLRDGNPLPFLKHWRLKRCQEPFLDSSCRTA